MGGSNSLISVSEIYGPVCQGEGPVLGRPTVFVRTGGCSLRCVWCDSLHAVLPEHRREWRSMEAEEILDRVRDLAHRKPLLVTLSGGDPAQQPCGPLIRMGQAMGYGFCVETQGVVAAGWLASADVVVLSPKPPSSGMRTDWVRFHRALMAAAPAADPARTVAVKVPVFSHYDLTWVEAELLPRCPVSLYLSVGNPNPPPGIADLDELLERWRWLEAEVVRRRLDVTVTPQAHVLLHGNARGR